MKIPIDTATSGDNTLATGVAGQSFRVTGYLLIAAGAVAVTFKSGSTKLSGAMSLITGTPVVAPESAPAGPMATRPFWFETAAGDNLVLNLGGNVQVSGHLSYDIRKL